MDQNIKIHYTVDCIYLWTHSRTTCFHVMSNVWVSGVKLSSFHAQMWSCTSRHYSKGRRFWSTRKEEIIRKASHFQRFAESTERTCTEVGRRLGCSFKSRYTPHFTFGWENFEVWHLRLRRLTSRENMFCASAFTGRCNRRWMFRGMYALRLVSLSSPLKKQKRFVLLSSYIDMSGNISW